MELQIKISNSKIEIEAISIVEDLWLDYLFFKKQALIALEENKSFLHKRYLRVTLLTLMSYFEAVVNNWCGNTLRENNKSYAQIQDFLRNKALPDKCKFLINETASNTSSPNKGAWQEAKKLRNELVHLKPGKDRLIFENLSIELLFQAEKEIIEWLDKVGKLLGQERHPDTTKIVDALSARYNNTSFEDDFADF
ncbi:MAG: hypothetical protein HS114_01315 [Anaerolineales bacterium]|nr:hypothetical protein [Anaerolineales bacterium]